MSKIVPLSKITRLSERLSFLKGVSVIVDKEGVPVGFVFGRDLFISYLELIDDEFEKKVKDPEQAYNNPAGKLIDLIESKLPLKPEVIEDIKKSRSTKKKDWIPMEEVKRILNV